jgi:hypothetical protein
MVAVLEVKMKIFLATFLILSLFVMGCSKSAISPIQQTYSCPDVKILDYDNSTGTYVQWMNCMPQPDASGSCNIDKNYQSWVNDNCGIKFEIRGAY